ncbi:MAG TPA: methyltransferase domain-containing protein [Bryobacteraceae bacterium]|nr:methyltransferase domain-containing protein [Bryobacteraceae bacterium]
MSDALQREIEYHEKLYSGFAQSHFAKPAVRALRQHMVRRIVKLTGAGKSSRVLSLGCGIGDTEILFAPHVGHMTGLDLSPSAIRQAKTDSAGIANIDFIEGTLESANFTPASFDAVIAIFFLHHLPDTVPQLARQIAAILSPGGVFYSLDPSRYRLSGAIGELLFPKLMARYQSPNERQLAPVTTAALFREAGLDARHDYYDFVSTPLAGLFPSWRAGYHLTRSLDEALIRTPVLNRISSNFEVVARKRS